MKRLSGRSGGQCAALTVVAAGLCYAQPAAGQAAPERARPNAYYAVHGGIIAGLAGTSLLLRTLPPSQAGADPQWFPGDASVQRNWSPAADDLSNVTLAVTVSAPMLAELGRGFDYRLLNAGVVYGETLTANWALNSLAKVLFARPRPYTHGPARDDAGKDPSDRYVSFYSGHSSISFASATAGSYLFAEGATDQASRVAFWGTEFALAAATANLRVIAGKHYYSDVLVGALVGSGLGIVIPLAHGANYAPRPSEYIAAGSGLVLGIVVTELLPLPNLAAKRAVASFAQSLSLNVVPNGSTIALNGRF